MEVNQTSYVLDLQPASKEEKILFPYLIKYMIIVIIPEKEFVLSKTRFTFSITCLVLSFCYLGVKLSILCKEIGEFYECGFDVVSQTFTKKYPDSNAIR